MKKNEKMTQIELDDAALDDAALAGVTGGGFKDWARKGWGATKAVGRGTKAGLRFAGRVILPVHVGWSFKKGFDQGRR